MVSGTNRLFVVGGGGGVDGARRFCQFRTARGQIGCSWSGGGGQWGVIRLHVDNRLFVGQTGGEWDE